VPSKGTPVGPRIRLTQLGANAEFERLTQSALGHFDGAKFMSAEHSTAHGHSLPRITQPLQPQCQARKGIYGLYHYFRTALYLCSRSSLSTKTRSAMRLQNLRRCFRPAAH